MQKMRFVTRWLSIVCKRVSRREEKRRVKYRRNKEKTSSAEEEKESSNSCFLGCHRMWCFYFNLTFFCSL